MNARTPLLAALALTLASTACQAPGQEPAGLSEEDVAAIRSILPQVDRAILAGDWGAAVAVMTEDGLWLPPNGPAIQGRDAMQAYLESADPAMTEHTLEWPEVDGRGDLAYARGVYAETFTVGEAPEPVEDVGKQLAVLRKQSDGSWLIAIWIWNSDLPLAEEGADTETW